MMLAVKDLNNTYYIDLINNVETYIKFPLINRDAGKPTRPNMPIQKILEVPLDIAEYLQLIHTFDSFIRCAMQNATPTMTEFYKKIDIAFNCKLFGFVKNISLDVFNTLVSNMDKDMVNLSTADKCNVYVIKDILSSYKSYIDRTIINTLNN